MEIKQEGKNFIVNTTIRASREIVHKLLFEIVGLNMVGKSGKGNTC